MHGSRALIDFFDVTTGKVDLSNCKLGVFPEEALLHGTHLRQLKLANNRCEAECGTYRWMCRNYNLQKRYLRVSVPLHIKRTCTSSWICSVTTVTQKRAFMIPRCWCLHLKGVSPQPKTAYVLKKCYDTAFRSPSSISYY